MNINQAIQLVRFILNKDQNGNITGDNFNLMAPIAQMSVLQDRLGNIKKYQPGSPIPNYGFSVSQKAREELMPLMVKPTTTAVAAGLAAYPGNYLYYNTLETAAGKLITEATQDEIVELNNSAITPPSTMFPKFVMHSDGFYIYPTSITSIKISYIRKPETPIWAYTISNNEEVYDAGNSQDFELNETTHFEIVMQILQMSGVNLNMLQVTQYAQAMEAQGK
jgi:hypothetical protein